MNPAFVTVSIRLNPLFVRWFSGYLERARVAGDGDPAFVRFMAEVFPAVEVLK